MNVEIIDFAIESRQTSAIINLKNVSHSYSL